jgi:hypothetical protein
MRLSDIIPDRDIKRAVRQAKIFDAFAQRIDELQSDGFTDEAGLHVRHLVREILRWRNEACRYPFILRVYGRWGAIVDISDILEEHGIHESDLQVGAARDESMRWKRDKDRMKAESGPRH